MLTVENMQKKYGQFFQNKQYFSPTRMSNSDSLEHAVVRYNFVSCLPLNTNLRISTGRTLKVWPSVIDVP